MKYSSTIRLVNLVIFALLGVGFGWLGVYFGLLVSPSLWLQNLPFGLKVPDMSLALTTLLGAAGLAGLIICVIGFVKSIFSLLRKDDEIVRQCFGCYISIGYLVAVFFLLNAVWLYRLITTNLGFEDIGFAIVVYVILVIVALIASSVPLVKMFGEGEGTNRVMLIISRVLVSVNFAVALIFFLAWINILTHREIVSHADIISTKFGLYALLPFLATLVGGLAVFGYMRAEKAGQYRKTNGIIFETALCIDGAGIIVAGVLNYIYKDGPYALMAASVKSELSSSIADEFSICSYIVGGLIVVLALVLIWFTIFPPKLKQADM